MVFGERRQGRRKVGTFCRERSRKKGRRLTSATTVLVVETTFKLIGACASTGLDAVVEAADVAGDA